MVKFRDETQTDPIGRALDTLKDYLDGKSVNVIKLHDAIRLIVEHHDLDNNSEVPSEY